MLRTSKDFNFDTFKFIIKFLWRASPKWNIVTTILLILQAIIPILILYQIKLIFDTVSHSINSTSYSEALTAIWWQLGVIIVLSIIINLLNSIEALVKEKHNQIIQESIQEVLHKQSTVVDLEYYERAHYYDTLHRAQTDTPGRILSIFNQFQSIFKNSITLIGLLSILLVLHWLTGIVILISIIPGIIYQFRYSAQLYDWQQKKTPTQRKANYYNWLLTGNTFAKELRTLDVGELLRKRAKSLRELLFNEKYNITKSYTFWGASTKIFETIAIYGLFLFLITRSLKGYLSLGNLIMYYQIFNRGQGSVKSLLGGVAGIYEDNLFLKNLIQFLNFKSIIKDPASPNPFPQQVHELEFRNISFNYPGRDKAVLQDITISMQAGDKIAIVGKNGSGKTSLIKLLCRLYNPTAGSIYINNIDYVNFTTQDLRKGISVLFQDYINYQLKAGENIWLGDISLSENDRKIKEAARYAGADEFIQNLPAQYETTLGKMFENGQELSTGQWQKLALSRTLFRDAPIIILDEPSSALDAKAERDLFEQISDITQDKILILISHRLSTIKSATCIYFLKDGEIKEYGTHEELMDLNGNYAEMFNLQSVQVDIID